MNPLGAESEGVWRLGKSQHLMVALKLANIQKVYPVDHDGLLRACHSKKPKNPFLLFVFDTTSLNFKKKAANMNLPCVPKESV